jgi:hypothetical protein
MRTESRIITGGSVDDGSGSNCQAALGVLWRLTRDHLRDVAPDPEASIERRMTSAEATDQKVLLPGGKCLLGTDDDNLGSRRARDISQSDAASGGHV